MSFVRNTPDRRALPVPPASQSMQSEPAAPLTFRFASVSISKLLPTRTSGVAHGDAAGARTAPLRPTAAATSTTAATTNHRRSEITPPRVEFLHIPIHLPP